MSAPLPFADALHADGGVPDFGAAILAMADALAAHSDDPPGLTCAYLTPAHLATAHLLRDWMQAAGLAVHIDAVGNVVGRLRGHGPDGQRRTLATGSHYDTVRNGGRYDGRLGILLPIAVAAHLTARGVTLFHDLEIVGFAEEEGVRFGSTFLGSSAWAGRWDNSLLERRDAAGVSMGEALRAAGHDPAAIPALGRDPAALLAYLEVHIEQGPVLLDRGLPLGIVTAIAGVRRFMVDLTGLASHAGTTPMDMRRDAACAAAEMVLAIETRCAGTPGLVGTVGQLVVPDGSINTIPGACRFSIDIRAGDDAMRDAAVADVLRAIETIAARRKVAATVTPMLTAACAPCAPRLVDAIEAAVVAAGVAPLRLPSGAGHDAMMVANITEVGMLFVRCGNGGISHHPDEILSAPDADLAARVFLDLVRRLAGADATVGYASATP